MSNTEALRQRLADEADLCRNDGANDIAALLDEARAALAQPATDDRWNEGYKHGLWQAKHCGAAPLVECNDSDSPWLVCKHCHAAGKCDKQPAASGEPVAWFCEWFNADGSPEWDQYHDRTDPMPSDDEWEDRPPDRVTPLYTAPQPAPARVPLPDEMMQQCRAECDDDYTKRGIFISGWIGAERAHGITAPGAPDAQPTRAEGE